MPPSRIQATAVNFFPTPNWLVALPSAQAPIDTTCVAVDTHGRAGIDFVCDDRH